MIKRLSFLVVSILVFSFLTSCGAVNSTTAIIDARHQIELAKLKEADIYAPYEFTKARLYLSKAKELQGHTEYQQAVIYAVNAKEFAKKAVEEAQKRKMKLEKIKRLKQQYK